MSAFTKAEKILETRGISPTDRARMRALVAHTAFIRGRDRLAIEYAQSLTSLDPMAASLHIGRQGWPTGAKRFCWGGALVCSPEIVYEYFTLVAIGCGLLVCPVALRLRRPHEVESHLMRAAVYPRTFYGLMARQALGLSLEFDWQTHELTEEEAVAVMRFPAGKRALALALVGEVMRAEEELDTFIRQ